MQSCVLGRRGAGWVAALFEASRLVDRARPQNFISDSLADFDLQHKVRRVKGVIAPRTSLKLRHCGCCAAHNFLDRLW